MKKKEKFLGKIITIDMTFKIVSTCQGLLGENLSVALQILSAKSALKSAVEDAK